MRRALLALTVVALFGVSGFAAWQTGTLEKLTDKSNGAIAVCEQTLVESLRSPSTYQRVSIRFTPAPALTYEEYVSYLDTQGCAARDEISVDVCVDTNRLIVAGGATSDWEHGSSKQVRKFSSKARTAYLEHLFDLYRKRPAEQQTTSFVQIDYDAANAYGTPIRSSHICRFGPRGTGKFDAGDMFISSLDEM